MVDALVLGLHSMVVTEEDTLERLACSILHNQISILRPRKLQRLYESFVIVEWTA